MATTQETNTVDQEATPLAGEILKAETEDIPIIAATEDLWIAEEVEVQEGMTKVMTEGMIEIIIEGMTIKEAMDPTEMTDPACRGDLLTIDLSDQILIKT